MFQCTRGDQSTCCVFRDVLFGVVWLWVHHVPISARPLTHLFVVHYFFLPSSQPSSDGEPLLACSVVLVFFFFVPQPSSDGEHCLARSVMLAFLFSFPQPSPDGELLLVCSVVLDFFPSSSQPSSDGEHLLVHSVMLVFYFSPPSCRQMVSTISRAQPCWFFCLLFVHSIIHLSVCSFFLPLLLLFS